MEGTLAVVKAAYKFKVKRVVITSSCASIFVRKPEDMQDSYNETDWSDVSACGPYEKSKTLAESAAWEYLNSIPFNERFELVVINPSLILGPSLIPGDFSSVQVI